jgi:hypothetical protein
VPNSADEPANSSWPIVNLQRVGDGRAVERALLRALVRRALISEGIINDGSIARTNARTDDSYLAAS